MTLQLAANHFQQNCPGSKSVAVGFKSEIVVGKVE